MLASDKHSSLSRTLKKLWPLKNLTLGMLKMPIPGKFSSLFGWTIKGKKIGAFYIFLQVFNSKLARFTTNVIK
jgi:hypothetical protein